jgi:hypothetical protein
MILLIRNQLIRRILRKKIETSAGICRYEEYPNKKLGFFLVFSVQGLLIIAVIFFHNASIHISDYCDTIK